jgi:hypothetical protein
MCTQRIVRRWLVEAPERKYNLAACLVISLIGAGIGALGVTGLFYPLTVWLIGLLPSGGLGIPPDVFRFLCPAAIIAAVLGPLAVGFLLTRPRFSRRRRHEKNAGWDAFRSGEEE